MNDVYFVEIIKSEIGTSLYCLKSLQSSSCLKKADGDMNSKVKTSVYKGLNYSSSAPNYIGYML